MQDLVNRHKSLNAEVRATFLPFHHEEAGSQRSIKKTKKTTTQNFHQDNATSKWQS